MQTECRARFPHLAAAADRVRAGDLSARVPEGSDTDELELLGRAFNKMTSQLEAQRDELIVANTKLEERRHFIETVLSGVSVGVVGLDARGGINVANRSASALLGSDLDDKIGTDLGSLVAETREMIRQARENPNQPAEKEVLLLRGGRGTQTPGANGFRSTG